MDKPISILFVCTGNTCRSSMAEGLAREILAGPDHGRKKWQVASAGTHARLGDPAAGPAIQVMAESGVDLSGHRAQSIQPSLIEAADYIFTMTAAQEEHLASLFPAAAEKIFTLAEWDIADPYAGTLEDYRLCAGELAAAVGRIIQLIEQIDDIS